MRQRLAPLLEDLATIGRNQVVSKLPGARPFTIVTRSAFRDLNPIDDSGSEWIGSGRAVRQALQNATPVAICGRLSSSGFKLL